MSAPAKLLQAHHPDEIREVNAERDVPLTLVAPRAADFDLPPGGHVARAAVRGAAIGVVSMTIIGTAISLVAGFGLVPSLAVGLFCAFWGGLGFGGMLGALSGLRHEQDITYPF
jgi:hypothetical protein